MKTITYETGRILIRHHNDNTSDVYVLTEPFIGTEEQLLERVKNLIGCRRADEDEVRDAFIQRPDDGITMAVNSNTIRYVNGQYHMWKFRRRFAGSRKALYKYDRKHLRIGISNRYAQYCGTLTIREVHRLYVEELASALNNCPDTNND